MAMTMNGEATLPAAKDVVWAKLNDADVLKACIPGCQSLELSGPNEMTATVVFKVGPVKATFGGKVTLSDLDPPNGYTIAGEGQGGMAGSARGGARVRLSDDAGGTRLSYDVDAQVAGRLAQLGGPIIDATAKQLAGQFFRKFGAIVERPGPTAVSPGSAREDAPASPRAYARGGGVPAAWILALIVVALVGYLVGRGEADDWTAIAVGAVAVVAALAGFLAGRR